MAEMNQLTTLDAIKACVVTRAQLRPTVAGCLQCEINDNSDLLECLRTDHQAEMLAVGGDRAVAIDAPYPPSVMPLHSLTSVSINNATS